MTQNSDDQKPIAPKRRRTKFTIITTIVAVVVIAACLLLAIEVARHGRAKRAAEVVTSLGGRVFWNDELVESIIYDKATNRLTDVYFTNPKFSEKDWLLLQELPQSFGLHASGPQVTDADLEYFKQLPRLDYLIFDDTKVTDQAVIDLKRARPELTIMFGYPHEADFREF